jgi:LssY C-terminus
LFVAPIALSAQQLDAGDTLHIRLLDRVRTHHHAHPLVRALIIAPVASGDGRILIPPGSVLSGHVTGGGMERFEGKRHWLELRFDSLAIPVEDATSDTIHAAVSLRIAEVDDARETVDSAGRIVGPPKPSVVHSKGDWAIVALGVFHPVGALVLAGMLEGEMTERHRALSFDAGRELTAVLTSRTMLPRWSSWHPPPILVSDGKEVLASGINEVVSNGINPDSIVASLPLRANLREGNAASDIIGLAVIGSAAQMHDALAAAGWTRAVPMSLHGELMTLAKAARGEGYAAQPVSELVLGRRPPDEVYEKVADTFLKRHHFRVWRWPAGELASDSTALWLIAASHDTGLMFSHQRHSFTHTVDPRIDLERDKIVNDLITADRVAAMSYVPRAAPERSPAAKDWREPPVTDWRMAVLVLR